MITNVYFVRHSKVDTSVHEDAIRPLSEDGLREVEKITAALLPKQISAIYASPYKRVIQTISDFAERTGLSIGTVKDLRERKVGDEWIDDFEPFARKQWEDYDYKLETGESMRETQIRQLAVLDGILQRDIGKNILIGTHGAALGTILKHFNPNFGFEEWATMTMPDIYQLTFEGLICIEMKQVAF